jgi:hypothetical protein
MGSVARATARSCLGMELSATSICGNVALIVAVRSLISGALMVVRSVTGHLAFHWTASDAGAWLALIDRAILQLSIAIPGYERSAGGVTWPREYGPLEWMLPAREQPCVQAGAQ